MSWEDGHFPGEEPAQRALTPESEQAAEGAYQTPYPGKVWQPDLRVEGIAKGRFRAELGHHCMFEWERGSPRLDKASNNLADCYGVYDHLIRSVCCPPEFHKAREQIRSFYLLFLRHSRLWRNGNKMKYVGIQGEIQNGEDCQDHSSKVGSAEAASTVAYVLQVNVDPVEIKDRLTIGLNVSSI